MIFQILVDIERVEFLGIETCEEHTYDQQQVERLHILFALFHALVHIVVVGAEVVGRKGRAEHRVVIVHNGLQLVRIHFRIGKPLVQPRLLVVLAGVRGIGKDGADSDFRIQLLENLVVAEQHRDGLNGKQRVVFSSESRLVVVVENELRNLPHARFALAAGHRAALIIFDQESQYVFIGNGILNQILVQAVAENFGRRMFLPGILDKDGCARKSEYL